MASGDYYCKDCGIYFDSARSLDVHLQYHKENLINMWMASDDRGNENISSASTPTSSADLSIVKPVDESNSLICGTSSNVYVKEDPSFIGPESIPNQYIKEEMTSFIRPSQVSPMEYDHGLSSPQTTLVSQGPASGSNSSVGFPQQSPSSFYQDYQQPIMQHPQQGGYVYQGSYNGSYDDQYFCRNPVPGNRYHPYSVRSPVPTPSPNASMSDIKDEPSSTPHTPEILDLDSQEVLNGSSQNRIHLPPMWRPPEQFKPHNTVSNTSCPPVGLEPPSPCLPQNPSGLGPSGMSATPMGMMPPMQQPPYTGHSPSNPVPSTVQSTPGGFRPSNNPLSSFYPQHGLSVSPGLSNTTTPTSTFSSSVAAVPNTSRDPPAPTEYPSNVKRAKSFKCDDCNKWFTSHGHLKRHYNTTLHKNMTKEKNSNPPSSTAPSTVDVTRPPIISPRAKSVGEASTSSSHDEESNISSNDATEAISNVVSFQHTPSAFQPPVNAPPYDVIQNMFYPKTQPGHIPPLNPVLSQRQHFLGNQPLPPPPTMYSGHFSANPTPYPHQTTPTLPQNSHFFPVGNNFGYAQPGGQHGPGFHSMNEFPGPNPVDVFNTIRSDSRERPMSQGMSIGGDSTSATSPDIGSGDTGSEASLDSSESEKSTTDNFRCDECSKSFNKMCYLTQHRTTYHEGEKPFKCGTCGKRFPDEVTFNDHQGKHAGEKPYKCEVCPKQFNHKTDLRRHMCLHTGEKPFSCEQCGKGFIRKDHMLKHFQTHRRKANNSHASNQGALTAHPSFHAPLAPHPSHGSRNPPHVPPVY